MFHQLKDFLFEFANGDPVWSDFVGAGDTSNDYVNEDQKTTTELEIHKAWKVTGAFGKPCVVMSGNDYLMESAECSSQAKFVCVKDTCPDGFSWFDHKSCIKVIDEPSTKSEAETKCMDKSARATLLMPKTQKEQTNLERWLKDSSMTTTFFLGAKKIENGWVWDDGRPVFIDGCNIGYEYGRKNFSAKGLWIAYSYFKDLGYKDDQIIIIQRHIPKKHLTKEDIDIIINLYELGVLEDVRPRIVQHAGLQDPIGPDVNLLIIQLAWEHNGISKKKLLFLTFLSTINSTNCKFNTI